MKKLGLIIPFSKYPSSSFFKFFSIVIPLMLYKTTSDAQIYGCHVVRGMSDVLYYVPYGIGPPVEWQTVISGTVTPSGETSGYRNDGSSTFGCIKDIGGPCTVYQQYLMSDGISIGMRIYKVGTFAVLSPVNCDLDDYIPALLLLIGGIGFVHIRKTKFCNA